MPQILNQKTIAELYQHQFQDFQEFQRCFEYLTNLDNSRYFSWINNKIIMTPHKYDEHEQYQTKKDLRNQLMPNFNFKNLWYVKFHVIPANRIYPGWVQDFQTELNDLLTTYSKQNPQFKSFVGILCYDHEEGWYRFHLFSTRQPDDVIIENHIVKSKKSLTIDYLTYTTQGTPEPEYVFQF